MNDLVLKLVKPIMGCTNLHLLRFTQLHTWYLAPHRFQHRFPHGFSIWGSWKLREYPFLLVTSVHFDGWDGFGFWSSQDVFHHPCWCSQLIVDESFLSRSLQQVWNYRSIGGSSTAWTATNHSSTEARSCIVRCCPSKLMVPSATRSAWHLSCWDDVMWTENPKRGVGWNTKHQFSLDEFGAKYLGCPSMFRANDFLHLFFFQNCPSSRVATSDFHHSIGYMVGKQIAPLDTYNACCLTSLKLKLGTPLNTPLNAAPLSPVFLVSFSHD